MPWLGSDGPKERKKLRNFRVMAQKKERKKLRNFNVGGEV